VVRVWLCIGLVLVTQASRSAIDSNPTQNSRIRFRQDPAPAAEPQDPARPSFEEFLNGVRAEALERGIREDILDQALATVEAPLAVVIERDRTQAETVFSLEDYLSRRLTDRQVARAKDGFARNRVLLEEIASQYGVDPPVIVAIWGMESNYGRFSGVRPTVAALATLAWDPRRSALFRSELFAALDILNAGYIEVSKMRGSWAGAMGQVQFMPSSYLKFAEDFDGDGRRDIWSTPSDVFASIGNFLKASGWTQGQKWGLEVQVPEEAKEQIAQTVARRQANCRARRDMTVAQPMAEWQQLGVRLKNGGALPTDVPDASLISGATRSFLVYPNYNALLDYNCSQSYAISVGLLADRLAKPPAPAHRAKAKKPTSPSARKQTQSARVD
jgi:membrane-bound lytic murein transglycosylase B